MTTARPPEGGQHRSAQREGLQATARPPEGGQHRSAQREGSQSSALPSAGGAALDHLVVLALDLAAGAAWMRDALGVAPGGGGAHPLMGTHNHLVALGGTPGGAFLETIACDPSANAAGGRRRWFDMDDAALQARVAGHGPQLVHWVARVADPVAAVAALHALGIDRGDVLQARRGDLQWRITVRPDGQRLFGGCLPTLIAWDTDAHPGRTLPPSGLQLDALVLRHPQADRLRHALAAIGLAGHPGIAVQAAAEAGLEAQLHTPLGTVVLHG